ncbi:MAG TPA: serine/threonine-protein kinase [Polyangiales bacterium]|nr:serine/threonine-protein kinase [Polyangiales bacterium]
MLKTLAAAPLDTESARAFLQRRLCFLAKLFACIAVGLHVFVRLVRLVAPREMDSLMGSQLVPLQLAALSVFVLVYLRLRKVERSQLELRTIDTLFAIGPAYAPMPVFSELSPHMRPELLLLQFVANVIVARAVLVPSTARRTLVLSTLGFLPVPVWTYWFYSKHGDPTLPPSFVYVAPVLAWMLATTVLSTIVSYTIFGLRKKVVEATQMGQYVLEHKIGQGGMGAVYRARHGLLRRPTAIKVLASDHADAHELRRFEREVKLTSRLTHPHTVAIYDYGRTPDGVFYYAMELLEGLDLQLLVETSGAQSASCVVRILEQVAGALSEAHALGLIHRDIKPANVILCERGGLPGFAKVVDFGLVKSVQNDATSAALSGVQTVVGTPLYMSPEQISTPEAVDGRSDLYSLGAVAYFLLTGTLVFEGRSLVEICGHHLYSQPAAPSSRCSHAIPSELEALVLQLLAKDPADRPSSALVLLARLRALPVPQQSDEELAAWWARALGQRAQKRSATQAPASPASAQTLAVDLRARAHLES